jgi:hypothetical protein
MPGAYYDKNISKWLLARLTVLMLLLCLVLVSLLSETYIITHENHEHDHLGVDGSCAACARIQAAENFLRQFEVIAGDTKPMFAFLITVMAALCGKQFLSGAQTLIGLKTRMNH